MTSESSISIRNSIFVKAYLIGLAVGLILWPIVGAALAAEIGVVLFWGLLLLLLVFKRISDLAWVRLAVEFVPPIALWVQFGFGGILAMLRVPGWDMYSNYDDLTVLLTTIFMMLGSFAYLFGIHIALGQNKLTWKAPDENTTGKAHVLLIVILAIDWTVRLQKNAAGVYVSWIANSGYFSELQRGTTNALYHLQRNIGMISIPLLIYLSMEDRLKWVFRFLLTFQLFLIFLEGDRSELLLALVVATSTYGLMRGVKTRKSVVAWAIVLGVLFFGIVGPIIQEARYQMQRDVRSLIQDNTSTSVTFATVYVPQAITTSVSSGNSVDGSLLRRLGGYSFYATSINQSILDGKAGLLLDDFLPAISQLTPRLIYADKGSRSANYLTQSHFKIGRVGSDAHGTPVSDIFGYGYVFGIMTLMFVMGLGFGLVVKYLTKEQGLLGGLIAIGMIPVFVPSGDSFVSYLAGLRNTVILIFIVFVVDFIYTIGSSKNKKSAESLNASNTSETSLG